VDWEQIVECQQVEGEEDSLDEDEELGVDCASVAREHERRCQGERTKVRGRRPHCENLHCEKKMIQE
jgi:hypothetical protein